MGNVKPKHKLGLVILLIALGMMYENSRNNTSAPTTTRTSYSLLTEQPLNERIQLYEQGLVSNIDGDYKYVPYRGWIPENSYHGNLIARVGRSMGNGIQNLVRESLRGLFRFFDGVIS